jgi:hypothetical protein
MPWANHYSAGEDGVAMAAHRFEFADCRCFFSFWPSAKSAAGDARIIASRCRNDLRGAAVVAVEENGKYRVIFPSGSTEEFRVS